MMANQPIETIASDFFQYAIENELLADWLSAQTLETQQTFLTYLFKNKLQELYLIYFQKFSHIHENYLFQEYAAISAERFGKFDLSLECYEKALYLNPKLISARINKGILQYQLTSKIDKKELVQITELVMNRKDRMQAKIKQLAMIYFALEDYKTSEKLFNELTNKTPLEDYHLSLCLEKQNKQANNEALSLFHTTFKEYQEPSTTLTVIFSPQPNKNLFNAIDFESDRLDFRDLTGTYYALSYQPIYQQLKEFIQKNHYKKIQLVGSSKAVLCLMNIYALLQKDYPQIQLSACAFAGFINLYPFNPDISSTPSYMGLVKLMSFSKPIIMNIKQMQEVAFNLQVFPQNKFSFIYGNKSKVDKGNGKFLKNCPTNIDILDFDYSGHSIAVPFTIPKGKSRAWMEEKYATIKLDNDLQAIDQSLLSLVDEIEAIYNKGLTLKDFL